VEIENKRREILGKPPMRREDVVWSNYWNKIHGVTPMKKRKEKKEQLPLPMEVGAGRIFKMNEPRLL